jgi:hypothetical protein
MLDALLVPGRMFLPIILCCAAFITVMSLTLSGIWEALPCVKWSDAFNLVVRRQGFEFRSPRIYHVIHH